MKVYLVKSIRDYEYGCREVEAVCATEESAEAYVKDAGGNYDVKFWTGEIFPYYIVEEWEVTK